MSRASRLAAAVPIIALVLLGPFVMTKAVSADVTSKYVVYAWSDPETHSLNQSHDQCVVYPRYNSLVAQVFLRGNPPRVITSGLVVEYRILCNAYSFGKNDSGRFWNYFQNLFGKILPIGEVLNLVDKKEQRWPAGKMSVNGGDFKADGIPVPPADEMDIWNPYHVAVIMVKNRNGTVLAQTRTAIPTSDEINCDKCHGVDPFKDILQRHDRLHSTALASKGPILCSNCHSAPSPL
jgi:hypothetical protein